MFTTCENPKCSNTFVYPACFNVLVKDCGRYAYFCSSICMTYFVDTYVRKDEHANTEKGCDRCQYRDSVNAHLLYG